MLDEQMRILLVAGKPYDAEMIERVLKESKLSCQFEWVADAQTAGTFLRQEAEYVNASRPDLILLDLEIDKRQLTEKPRQAVADTFLVHPPFMSDFGSLYSIAPDIPIVVLSNFDDEDIAVRAVHEGAQDYLVKKKIDAALLSRAIRYAVERKRTEDQLQRSETYFRSLIENSSDITLTINEQNVITYINPSIEKILEYSVSEIVGYDCYSFVHPDDVKKVRQAIDRIKKKVCAANYIELRVQHKD